ncbi:MAG: glucose-1-phosphate cytidylyltransferase [Holophagales bacterium]|jgi:glucose-1-phosphate cytidylyltransferase|nr:glucose-1-phosphate cytidylyltransferase [Holophagales bacterium]
MKVVILAGGQGTRISEESHMRPKPMIEIGGYPILWHIMKYYSRYGHSEFVICCGYMGNVIKEFFSNYFLHHSDVTFDFTDNNHTIIHSNVAEPWKVSVINTGLDTMTGGRVKRIQPYVGNEPFLMTYGDGVSDIDLPALIKQHVNSGKTVTVSATQPSGRFGVLEIDEETNSVTGFSEKAVENKNWINAGFMVMDPGIFDYIKDDNTILERAPMERLCADGSLGVFKHYGYWQCMDTQRDKQLLEQQWNSGHAPWKVW